MEKTSLLDRLQKKIGHSGIKFFIYIIFFAVHIVISTYAYLPTMEPNEFSAAALANMMLGGDWTEAMGQSSYYYGFLQAVFYIPAMAVTKDPFVQYSIMVITNGAIMSFIPVMVYSSSLMLGVKRPWQAVTAAVCVGGWTSCMINSKFIWNETLAIFIPFFVLHILLKTDLAEKKSTKRLYSVLLGMTAGLSFCAHERLFAMIMAITVTLLISRFLLKRKTACLGYYFTALIIFLSLSVLSNYFVQEILWGVNDPTKLRNTAERFFANLPEMLSDGGVKRFFISLLSQIYYFMSASWGLGALGLSLFILVTVRIISAKVKRRKHEQEPRPLFIGERSVFMFYTAFLTLFMLFISVCYRFGADNFYDSQSTVLFGRYLDGVIPFTVMLILVFIFTEELLKNEIYGGVIALGASYTMFFLTGRTVVLSAVSSSIIPILCIYPTMFGESTSSLVTSTGLIAAVSCSLCVMAVFLVIVSCSKKLKNAILSFVILLFTLYSASFGVLYYLPISRGESVDKYEEYIRLSEYVYNSVEAPPVTIYQCDRSCVMAMQYLNQNSRIYVAEDTEELKEDTFVLLPSDTQIRFEGQGRPVFELLGETENFRIYAYGERAKAYVQAQSGNNTLPAETSPEITSDIADSDVFETVTEAGAGNPSSENTEENSLSDSVSENTEPTN